jgi:plastocyanin
MKFKFLPLALVLASLAFACGDDDDTETPPTSAGAIPQGLRTIMVLDNRFLPLGLQVPVGTEVTWQWDSRAEHSIVGTFDGKEVRSETQSGKETFKFAFEKAGTFEYQCGVHGASMSGTVTLD